MKLHFTSTHPGFSSAYGLGLFLLLLSFPCNVALAEHSGEWDGETESSGGAESGGSFSLGGSDRAGVCGKLKDRPQEGPMACWATASAVIKDFLRGDGKVTHETEMSKKARNGERKRETDGGHLPTVIRILRRSGLSPKRSALEKLTKPGTVAIVQYDNGEGGSHYIAVCVREDGQLQVADSQEPEHGSSTNTTMSASEIPTKKGRVMHVLEVKKGKGLRALLGI